MADDKPQDPAVIGPFTDEEIETAARAAVQAMGRDWDRATAKDKIGFVQEAKLILAGGNVSSQFGYLVPGATDAVRLQYKTLVLQEFRRSPKWDEAAFKGGFAPPAAAAADTDTGSEATQ